MQKLASLKIRIVVSLDCVTDTQIDSNNLGIAVSENLEIIYLVIVITCITY